MVHFGSANGDECVFAAADRLDPDREDLGRHVAFGKGIHFCICAPLARLELRVALPLLVEQLPGLRAAPEPHEREPSSSPAASASCSSKWDTALRPGADGKPALAEASRLPGQRRH
jgi:cytochrome P450